MKGERGLDKWELQLKSSNCFSLVNRNTSQEQLGTKVGLPGLVLQSFMILIAQQTTSTTEHRNHRADIGGENGPPQATL
ncbi:hypothetical protein CFP56_015828 [Quercus suber]|uniref:Uncharacterized protein n=1 Tax=Quercus suber TaxID=58331 RepID=A0AAW0M523_QUESU